VQPEPEDDAQLSGLLGSAPSPDAVVLAGLAMLVTWPLAKLAGIVRRRLPTRSP